MSSHIDWSSSKTQLMCVLLFIVLGGLLGASSCMAQKTILHLDSYHQDYDWSSSIHRAVGSHETNAPLSETRHTRAVIQESANAFQSGRRQIARLGQAATDHDVLEGAARIEGSDPVRAAERELLSIFFPVIGLLVVGILALLVIILYRRRYEKALRRSEQRYRDLFDHSPDIIYTHDMDGNYTSVNEAGLKILGMSRDEFIGMNFRKLVDPEFLPTTENFFRMKLEGKVHQTGPYQLAVKAKDGRTVWFEVNTRTIFQDGKAVGVQGVARDITERKLLEQQLEEAQERYRSFVEEAQDGIIETDAKGRFTFVNEITTKTTGYSRSELLGKSYLDLVDPEFRETAKSLYRSQLARKDQAVYVEMPILAKDGRRIWLGVRTSVFLEGDKLKSVRSIARDITERKKAEEALKESERRYKELYRMMRLMCDNVPDMIWAKDVDKRFLFANRAICHDLLGAQDTDEPVGKTDMFFAERERSLHADNPHWHTFGEICADSDAVVMEEKVPRRFDEFGNVKGQFLYLDVYKAPLLDEAGNMIGTVGCARVVTEERRREEEQARLITAINQTADTVMITDTKGVIQFVNPAFEKITGYSREEVLGKTPSVLKSGKHSPEFYKTLWRTLREKKVWTGHFINKKKDGTLYEEDATITPVRDSSGRVTSYVAVKRDVTNEAMLQKELLHSQKMEAIGTLAGGIAHDLNNVLQVILGYCQLLTPRLQDDTASKGLQAIATATRRAGDLVSRVLTFSRKIQTEARPLELNHEIRRIHELLQRTIPKMIQIQLRLADDLHLIHADAVQIEQILMNLSVNAAHAMPDGGVLSIQTENVSLDEDFCSRHAGAVPGEYILLTVSDTGCGMEKDILERIFEPFFTTKKVGEGTGLGLSMVYGIVAAHNGFILCDSQPGAGATFRIYFPRFYPQVEEAAVQESTGSLLGNETVLLVDDEDEVVSLARDAFAGYGYTLLTARTGEEALELYKAQGNDIDIVVLDLVMPGMGGRTCLKELIKLDPTARVVIASGFATEETVKQVLKSGARSFVKKPFEFEDLLLEIRKVLDEGRPK